MNREDELDLQLTRWLEEGPVVAPDRPVAAAIEHARAHPRRRLSRSVLWRSAMDSMHLAPVTPRHTNNLGRALAVAFVAIVVVATTIVFGTSMLGRGGGTGGAPGGAVAPAATATPVPTLAPTPSPTPVAVTGTSYCGSQGGTDTQVGDVEQIRGLVLGCSTTASDARVSGWTAVHTNIDIHPDKSAEIWGTATITGPDGTWTGPWTGFVEKGYSTHRMAAVMQGTGAYEGLQYRYTQTSADGAKSTSTGVIEAVPSFAASAPVTGRLDATGTEACGEAQVGTSGSLATIDGVEQTRNAFVACTEIMSDPRIRGGSTRTFNSDAKPDGSQTWWGTGEITNTGGSWLGVWSGTMDAAQNVQIAGSWIGSGGYAGLQYRSTVTMVSNASEFTVNAVITPVQ